VGALTAKCFPFELRGWDTEKFEGIDPTDGFGANIKIYISKDQIIQIEPDYDISMGSSWLTDKGRQFFDGIFNKWTSTKNVTLKKDSWSKILNQIIKYTYLFDHCNKKFNKNYSLTLVFENLSFEILNFLNIISQTYSFIKVRRAENFKINNDIESMFQLNATSSRTKLSSSTLCLLVATNTRYEGYYLNLRLRQRFFKGNFKCLTIGTLLDLTFPVSFLGAHLKCFKTIAEGNNLICQAFKSSKNPILIFNNELFKRNDGENIIEILKILAYANILNQSWNGLNMLNSSLVETGVNTLTNFLPITYKDLTNFSSLYFLNVTKPSNISNFKKITQMMLLNSICTDDYEYHLTDTNSIDISNFPISTKIKNIYLSSLYKKTFKNSRLLIDQNNRINCNFDFSDKISTTYLHLPTNTFYENEEIYINTEGLIKRTTKLMSRKKTKNNWQILKKILTNLKKTKFFLTKKDNFIICLNSKKIYNFKNFCNFKYYTSQNLTNLNFYLNIKNKPIILSQNTIKFKQTTKKFFNTKLKYWLDDFFSGGKDEYTQNSLILSNCSKFIRSESTNFF
jgi:hypothetical protein